MSISERAAHWIYLFLQSPEATSNFAAIRDNKYDQNTKLSLRHHGLSTLKVHEIKAVSSFLCQCVVAAKIQSLDHIKTSRPSTCAKKQEHAEYIQRLFAVIDASPAAWDALETSSSIMRKKRIKPKSQGSNTIPGSYSSSVPSMMPCNDSRLETNPSIWNLPSCNHMARNNNTCTGPLAQSAIYESEYRQNMENPKVEYWKGIELIDLVKYQNKIPLPLLNELQRLSFYKGFPSKLRYEQVKIKQEPKRNNGDDEYDAPKDETEVQIANSLRYMGFQDMQEIMVSMRHIQNENPLVEGEALIDMIMMYIVQQREEKEESKKMDAARIQSEQVRILRERDDRHYGGDHIQIIYTADELLGLEGKKPWIFKDSLLLQSPKVKKLFSEFIKGDHDDTLLVQKLLDIEKKSKRWYGDTTDAFFRFILCEKIEVWHDQFLSNAMKTLDQVRQQVRQLLETEMSYIEKELYLVSDDSEHIREPRIFKAARDAVIARGLMSNVIHIT